MVGVIRRRRRALPLPVYFDRIDAVIYIWIIAIYVTISIITINFSKVGTTNGKAIENFHNIDDEAITGLQNVKAVNNKNVDPSPSTIFVVSLQGTPGVHKSNEGRLDTFKEQWSKACGSSSSSTRIEHCPGVYDERPGYGIVLSWYFCLYRAKELDLEVAVVFEDDARLFDTMTADFCDVKRRGELFSGLLPSDDAFLAFLGGHSWSYAKAKLAVPYQEVKHSYGAYGFAVPRQSIDMFLDTLWHGLINGSKDRKGNTHHDSLDPGLMFYEAAHELRKKIYVGIV